jgi:hypothetical protein
MHDGGYGTMTSSITVERPLSRRSTLSSDASSNPRREKLALAVFLAVTTALWSDTLSRNGWENAFDSAAVLAGAKSSKAFLVGSSDRQLHHVDKPPASPWPMAHSRWRWTP